MKKKNLVNLKNIIFVLWVLILGYWFLDEIRVVYIL